MTRTGRACIALSVFFAAAMSLRAGAAAQTTPVPQIPEQTPGSAGASVQESGIQASVGPEQVRRSIVRIAQDYTLNAGDAVRQMSVIFGNATVEGHVVRDVVVVFGDARLAATASIDGSLTVVGGTVSAQPGAVVRRDLVVVGGTFDAPAGFSTGGEHVVIGPRILAGRLSPWITRGLLWGRPIVPQLAWIWTIVGIFLFAYLVLNLAFHRPVSAIAETLLERPLSAFAVGLLVLLLIGPVCVLLAVSVIGLVVVPFVLVALFVAWTIGKVGVARSLGLTVMRQSSIDSRLEALRSFAIGFVLITLAYTIPVVGFATWAMVGVFGLGSATLAFIAAYRSENPSPIVAASIPPPTAPGAVDLQDGEMIMSGNAALLQDLASFPRASLRDRVAAAFLDLIVVMLAAHFMDRLIRDNSVFFLLLVYHIGFLTWKGTTIGGIICQLRVVRVDSAPIRFIDALVRGLSSLLSIAVVGLGFLWILKDPERQAWHDKIAGTYVVKVPRNWPL